MPPPVCALWCPLDHVMLASVALRTQRCTQPPTAQSHALLSRKVPRTLELAQPARPLRSAREASRRCGAR